MSVVIKTEVVHHVALTVSDVHYNQQFCTELLGFNFLVDFGLKVLLHNDSVVLALNPPLDPEQALPTDWFIESRIALDHMSLSVASMADLQAATNLFDARYIAPGEIKLLEPSGISLGAFRDPDDNQVGLTHRVHSCEGEKIRCKMT